MILDDLIINMGVSLETYVLLIIVLGSLIFMAIDMRLGLVIMFLLSSIFLVIFNYFDRNITYYIYVVLLSFVTMTISLMISNKKSEGVII